MFAASKGRELFQPLRCRADADRSDGDASPDHRLSCSHSGPHNPADVLGQSCATFCSRRDGTTPGTRARAARGTNRRNNATPDRRTIPPAPPRQLFLVCNDPDDPYTAFLGAGIHCVNTQSRRRHGDAQAHANGEEKRKQGGQTATAAGSPQEQAARTATSFFYTTSLDMRRQGRPPRPLSSGNPDDPHRRNDETVGSPASRSAATLPPCAARPQGSSVGSPTAGVAPASPPANGEEASSRGAVPSQQGCGGRPHTHMGLPKNFSRRFYEPIELQVESLTPFVVKMVFALWYLLFLACIVVEVIPQAQWSVVNICGRGLNTDLRYWDRWSSMCVAQTPTSATGADTPAGAMDITWTGHGLGFLNDNLKLYRRVVVSLPRSDTQTQQKMTYTLQARVRATVFGSSGSPDVGAVSNESATYTAELTCERKRHRCHPVRFSEEMVLLRPDVVDDERVEVTLVAVPPELANAVATYSASVGVVYQKRAYTLGSLIWRYVFLLLSFLHLLRFIVSGRYTATLYEQSWVTILQIALFWYLNPFFACNMVTQPLPLVLAFLEFRIPTFFITVTFAFMFSVMSASMYWQQRDGAKVAGQKGNAQTKAKATRADAAAENDKERAGGQYLEEEPAAPSSEDENGNDTSSSSSCCSACDDLDTQAQRPRKSLAARVWAALFTSPNVYDPPVWTKIITMLYVAAVFALEIVDAALEPEQWGPSANSSSRFLGLYWSVIALLLAGGLICLFLLLYVRNYLGNKPYLESRPQQLACRVFIMVFLTTIVYYVIHCFVFFLHYNRNFSATASRSPFLQLPAVMLACGFTNIMTLVYTSRSRNEGVPIHPSDQRWKYMVWPDTWYRWLARHGGSQYIFFSEEEETRFYKTQFEFRKRQFLAKLKRKRAHGQARQRRGSRTNSQVGGDSFAEDLSWLTDEETPAETARTRHGGRRARVGGAASSPSPGAPVAATQAGDRELVVGVDGDDAAPAAPASAGEGAEGNSTATLGAIRGQASRRKQVRSPADYQTLHERESPLPLPEYPSIMQPPSATAAGAAAPRRGSQRDSLKDSHQDHLNATRATSADGRGGAASRKDGDAGDGEGTDELPSFGRANTLRVEDLRALHLAQTLGRGEQRTGGGHVDADDDEGELTFAPARPQRGTSIASLGRSRNFRDALFQRMYGRKVMNMDRFSTFYLAEGNGSGSAASANASLAIRKDGPNRTTRNLAAAINTINTANHNHNQLHLSTSMDDEAAAAGSSIVFHVEGPVKRRSRRLRWQSGARGDTSASSLDGESFVLRRTRSHRGLSPAPQHRRSCSCEDGGGGGTHMPALLTLDERSAGLSATTRTRERRLNITTTTNNRVHATSRNADESVLLAEGGESADTDEEKIPLRAYEQFVPESDMDGSEKATNANQHGGLFLRSFARAREKLGELVGAAERALVEKPMRNLDRLETGFFDAAYRPFQSVSYLPFFNLETALDCFNMSWEAYGVEESAGDAKIETGLKVAPENVPKAAVQGVKTVFFGCCPASESDLDDDDDANEMGGRREGQKADSKRPGAQVAAPATAGDAAAVVATPPSREDQAEAPAAPSAEAAAAVAGAVRHEDSTVSIPVDDVPSPPAAQQQQQQNQQSSQDATPSAPLSSPTAAAAATAAATAGLLPINCGKYGFELLFVTEIKAVQVLICRMDVTAREHAGKAPRILIAFRGTANLSNAKYDANMHRVVWREMEEPLPSPHNSDDDDDDDGNDGGGDSDSEAAGGAASAVASTVHKAYLGCASCCRSVMAKTSWRPTCHAGFLAIWRAMQPVVMPKIVEVIKQNPETVYRIFTTGHSLGGALASLCAYSVHRKLLLLDYPIPDVTVYTFGQPCMGNRTFRRLYDKAVPRSFRIMNESDMVVTFTMFGGYHVGIEVSVDRNGNFIVKPTDIEKMFSPTKGRGMSLLNHLMTNYGISLNSIAKRTTCAARGLECYITADPEKIAREKAKAEPQKQTAQEKMHYS